MGFVKTLARAVVLSGKENTLDLISTLVMPGTQGALKSWSTSDSGPKLQPLNLNICEEIWPP
jgi:hypothetical protein